MLAVKELFPIKELFKIPTYILDNLNTRQRRKDHPEMIRIWFKYQMFRLASHMICRLVYVIITY